MTKQEKQKEEAKLEIVLQKRKIAMQNARIKYANPYNVLERREKQAANRADPEWQKRRKEWWEKWLAIPGNKAKHKKRMKLAKIKYKNKLKNN